MKPMLAKASVGLPADESRWLYEIKWDGYRCVAHVNDGVAVLVSRSGKALDFPQIADELRKLPPCVLDGEVVVLDEDGRSNFEELRKQHPRAIYVVFDALEIAGESVASWGLCLRRNALFDLGLTYSGRVAVSPAFEDGEELLDFARARKLEGIMAKRRGSSYRPGIRSDAWLKIKVRHRQEFVVVGWTPGKNGRTGRIGAVTLAVTGEEGLVYVGKCGVDGGTLGAAADTLRAVEGLLGVPVECPLARKPRDARDVTWVAPRLVVEVEFQRWTEDGRLWHPSFKGVRHDKSPAEVRKEE